MSSLLNVTVETKTGEMICLKLTQEQYDRAINDEKYLASLVNAQEPITLNEVPPPAETMEPAVTDVYDYPNHSATAKLKKEHTMSIEELSFIGGDPGAVKYGNFINYYTFHSAEQRIQFLEQDMFAKVDDTELICLDIGCNSGELTKKLLQYLQVTYPDQSIKVLAVDIDPTLISRAQMSNENTSVEFKALDISDIEGQQQILKYLQKFNQPKFHITFCFSVTMWIHINKGDIGFENFLEFIADISESIIVEPQPWRCYQNAQRRLKKSGGDFPFYHILKVRSEVATYIENVITRKHHVKVFESQTSSWRRKVQSYQRLK